MGENGSVLPSTNKYTNLTPSFFTSPKLFTVLSPKGFCEAEALRSPTSILDSKPFSTLGTPIWGDRNTTTASNTANKHPWGDKLDSRGLGIAIAATLNGDSQAQKLSKPDRIPTPMVLFGSQLKIQIPPISLFPLSPIESPKSPIDFGIKTRRNSQSLSPSLRKSPFGSANLGSETSPRVFTGYLSASDMESSEEYTCVITRGPNPKTTHIFDDCIVDNCCGVIGLSGSRKGQSEYPAESFLSSCYTCKKNLGQGRDIYIYRGEKAFCSQECRYQEILLEEGMEKSE